MHDFGNSENPESHPQRWWQEQSKKGPPASYGYRRPGQVSPNPFEHTSFSDFDAAKPGNGFRHTNSNCFAPFLPISLRKIKMSITF